MIKYWWTHDQKSSFDPATLLQEICLTNNSQNKTKFFKNAHIQGQVLETI